MSDASPSVSGQEQSRSFHGAQKLMNDLLYYAPLANLCEADATYQEASTQVRFGYLTLAASFHLEPAETPWPRLADVSSRAPCGRPRSDPRATALRQRRPHTPCHTRWHLC